MGWKNGGDEDSQMVDQSVNPNLHKSLHLPSNSMSPLVIFILIELNINSLYRCMIPLKISALCRQMDTYISKFPRVTKVVEGKTIH